MRFTIEIRRRHIALVPKALAFLTFLSFAGATQGLNVVALVTIVYCGSALLLAFVDHAGGWAIAYRRIRRTEREIEASIRLHPAGAHARVESTRPRFTRRRGAAA